MVTRLLTPHRVCTASSSRESVVFSHCRHSVSWHRRKGNDRMIRDPIKKSKGGNMRMKLGGWLNNYAHGPTATNHRAFAELTSREIREVARGKVTFISVPFLHNCIHCCRLAAWLGLLIWNGEFSQKFVIGS